MITYSTYSMWFVVWTHKPQLKKLICYTIHLHFLMLSIFIMSHIILLFCPLFLIDFFCFPWYIIPCFRDAIDKCFWNSCAKLTSKSCAAVFTSICVSNYSLPGSCTAAIRWSMKPFYIVLMPSTTTFLYPGALIIRSIILLKDCNNIENKYKYAAHL